MLIPCPVCGLRDQSEFTYGGDATIVRPELADTNAARWADYVYDRRNPRGPHQEYWHHIHGCRTWLIVERNTEIALDADPLSRLRSARPERVHLWR